MAALDEGVAIVTGGGSGMGRGVALRFGSLGTKVVVVGRSRDNIEETVALVRANGGEARSCLADVSVEEDAVRMVDFALQHYGRLDFAADNPRYIGRIGLPGLPPIRSRFTRCRSRSSKRIMPSIRVGCSWA